MRRSTPPLAASIPPVGASEKIALISFGSTVSSGSMMWLIPYAATSTVRPSVSTNGILYRTVDLVFWLFPTPIRLRGGPGIGFSPMSLAASWVISVTCDPVSQNIKQGLPAAVLIRCVTS
jgi:hypothetical protein